MVACVCAKASLQEMISDGLDVGNVVGIFAPVKLRVRYGRGKTAFHLIGINPLVVLGYCYWSRGWAARQMDRRGPRLGWFSASVVAGAAE